MTNNPHFIQFRGYYSGPNDMGVMTSLHTSPEEALACARRCSYRDSTAWVNPEFVGMMDTVLRAVVPIDYIEWKPTPKRKTIQPGERFTVGDILVADHQITRAVIGLWIISGKAEVVAQEQLPETMSNKGEVIA
jgi:hypothetical protein